MQVRQGMAKGLWHAVLCTKSVIGDSPLAVILPDIILDKFTANQHSENLASMIKRFKETQ